MAVTSAYGRVRRLVARAALTALVVLAGACRKEPAAPQHAAAVRPDSPCSLPCPETGPCVVKRVVAVGDDTVDCRDRDVVVESGGRIEAKGDILILRCHDLTVMEGGAITASATGVESPIGMLLDVRGSADIAGVLRADSPFRGGTIDIDAKGDISVRARADGSTAVSGDGTAATAPGGDVALHAGGRLTIDAPVSAGALLGVGNAEGGEIELSAAEDVVIKAPITAVGNRASGGTLKVRAGRSLTVAAPLRAEGYGDDADGGEIEIGAPRIAVQAKLSAAGGIGAAGGEAYGGIIVVEALGAGETGAYDIDVAADLDASPSAGTHGGGILVDCEGDVQLREKVTLTTRTGADGGVGGDLTVRSRARLRLGRGVTLDARGGGTGGGRGGDLNVSGCRLSVADETRILTSGDTAGSIQLTGAEELTVSAAAKVEALGTDEGAHGEITLTFKEERATCGNDPNKQCDTDADCDGAPCVRVPDTGGTLRQFRPKPELDEDEFVDACPEEPDAAPEFSGSGGL